MANGDAAAAAGMDVVPSTAQVRLGYDEINKTRDYIVTKGIPAGGLPITQGGTGGITLAAARANLGISTAGIGAAIDGTSPGGLKFTSTEFGRIRWEAPGIGFPTPLANQADVNFVQSQLNGKLDKSGGDMSGYLRVNDHIYVPNAFAATSGFVVAYINGPDGRLSRGSSSRRYKTDIRPQDLTQLGDVLALRPVKFKWRASFAPDLPSYHREIGLIAEDVAEAAPWLAVLDNQGQVESVRYEMLGLALLPIVQDLARRVAQLEGSA